MVSERCSSVVTRAGLVLNAFEKIQPDFFITKMANFTVPFARTVTESSKNGCVAVKLMPFENVPVGTAPNVTVPTDGPPVTAGNVLLTAPRRTSYAVDPEVITGVVSDVPFVMMRELVVLDQYGVAYPKDEAAPRVTAEAPQEVPFVTVGATVIGQNDGIAHVTVVPEVTAPTANVAELVVPGAFVAHVPARLVHVVPERRPIWNVDVVEVPGLVTP